MQDILYERDQLFIALTETWLSNHSDPELAIKGYSLFRSDRKRKKSNRGRSSGGVAIYMKEDVATHFKVKLQYSNGVNELLVLDSVQSNTIIAVVYRQPDDSSHGHPSGNKEFCVILEKLRKIFNEFDSRNPDIFICGDFNLPNIDWNKRPHQNDNCRSEMINTLFEFMDEFHIPYKKGIHFRYIIDTPQIRISRRDTNQILTGI